MHFTTSTVGAFLLSLLVAQIAAEPSVGNTQTGLLRARDTVPQPPVYASTVKRAENPLEARGRPKGGPKGPPTPKSAPPGSQARKDANKRMQDIVSKKGTDRGGRLWQGYGTKDPKQDPKYPKKGQPKTDKRAEHPLEARSGRHTSPNRPHTSTGKPKPGTPARKDAAKRMGEIHGKNGASGDRAEVFKGDPGIGKGGKAPPPKRKGKRDEPRQI